MPKSPIIVCLILGLTISLALYLLNWQYQAVSFLIGAGAAVVYLFFLRKQAEKLLQAKTQSVKKQALSGVFIRYLFLIVVIVVAVKLPGIQIPYLLAGLILIPFSAFMAGWAGTTR